MLSGLRVVSREEATSDQKHTSKRTRKERKKSKHHRKKHEREDKFKRRKEDTTSSASSESDSDSIKSDGNKKSSVEDRKALGLEWMVKAPPATRGIEKEQISINSEVDQKVQVNPKEVNPYLKDGGDGYPSEDVETSNFSSLSTHAVVGDGGLSWRLKALKRAKEQAERDGRSLDKVVEERWGSLAEMTASISGKRAAHAHAHLRAIRDRKHSTGGRSSEGQSRNQAKNFETGLNQEYLKDVQTQEAGMKVPKVSDSLSWKRRKEHLVNVDHTDVFREAVVSLNKFKDDGSFLQSFQTRKTETDVRIMDKADVGITDKADIQKIDEEKSSDIITTSGLSANQLAAKSLQLRLSGKIKEAEELEKQLKNINNEVPTTAQRDSDMGTRYKPNVKSIIGNYQNKMHQRNSGDDRLKEEIIKNRQYSLLTSADDEYDFGNDVDEQKTAVSRKKDVRNVKDRETQKAISFHKRIVTQEERCQFCFTNPSRPGHLTVSIANTCYLMLPPWEPLIEGHCLIVPMQHEGSSRNVDESVWEELRNYKKCLIKMFAGQNKDVLFMETAMHLAKQRRHCLIECIPLSPDIAKQAPLYFKKAIDEAEDEWSQHNAKKLIDTTGRGLRACIPKNFPYFHVEFGLRSGYVHVIDDEKDFKSDFGRNVIIGMLKLPEEEMYRRRRQHSYEQQKRTAVEFQQAWDPFDWTKMLD